MGYQSEAQLEKNLHTQLVNQGYQPVKIADYDALLTNFKHQLNQFNEHKLGGQPLTDIEFKRILTLIESKSIYNSAKILRDKLLIEREDGSQLYVELMNTKDWCKNLFQVTTQSKFACIYIKIEHIINYMKKIRKRFVKADFLFVQKIGFSFSI